MPTLVYRDTGVSLQNIRQESPTTIYSNGTENALEAATSSHIRMLGLFPMAPPGGVVTVTSAVLTLFNLYNRATSRTVEMRRVVTPWIAAQASWTRRNTVPTLWATAGAIGADTSAVIATGTVPATANTAFDLTGSGLLAYCQDILNGGTDNGYITNLLDDLTVDESGHRGIAGTTNATAARRPTLTINYTVGTPPNWTVSNPTVDSDAGTATAVLTLEAPAPAGGVSGFFSTYDITAAAGVNYTTQTAVEISIAEGDTTANLTVPLIP